MKRRHAIAALAIASLLAGQTAAAEDGDVPRRQPYPYIGLSVVADAHALWAGDATANFYSGRPTNANTISRVLYSNSYGTEIWTNLKNRGLINSSVGSYHDLQVAEYANMYYRLAYQVGLGLRYDYPSGFGWMLRFELAQLTAAGQFLLNSTTNPVVLSGDPYVPCDIMGREERINIDLALLRTAQLSPDWEIELDLGLNLNNTKVKENAMQIAGVSYSILDIWNGEVPDLGVGDYEYINQGGIGYGLFLGAWVGYRLSDIGAVRVGYTLYHSRTTLEGYSAWTWNHLLGLRFEMNNFSFFD